MNLHRSITISLKKNLSFFFSRFKWNIYKKKKKVSSRVELWEICIDFEKYDGKMTKQTNMRDAHKHVIKKILFQWIRKKWGK